MKNLDLNKFGVQEMSNAQLKDVNGGAFWSKWRINFMIGTLDFGARDKWEWCWEAWF